MDDEDDDAPAITFSLPTTPARPSLLPVTDLPATPPKSPTTFTIPTEPISPSPKVNLNSAQTQLMAALSGPAKADVSAAETQIMKALSAPARADVSASETQVIRTLAGAAKPVARPPSSPPPAAWKASILANQLPSARPQTPADPRPATAKKPEGPKPKTVRLKVSAVAMASFLRRFQALLESGVPLVSSLGFLADSEDSPALRQVLEKLSGDVSSGHRFSDAMRAPLFRSIFSPIVVSLVQLGEETGNLTTAIERAADLMDADLRMRRAVLTALTYPCALLIAISLAAVLFVSILGADGGLFAMFGDDLPLPTRILVGVARFLRQPFLIAAAVALLIGAGTALRRLVRRNRAVRAWLHWAVLQIPGVGLLLRKTIAARMLYVMSNCIIVGLPMIQALKLMRNTCGNQSILRGFDEALKEFIEGVPLSEGLQRSGIFPPMVSSMLSVGEETGTIDQILERMAEMLEDDVMTSLKTAMQLIEPLLLMFAGCLAGFLAIATLLPIIELAQKL